MARGGEGSPLVADVAGDPRPEVIVALDDGLLVALGNDGKTVSGWPLEDQLQLVRLIKLDWLKWSARERLGQGRDVTEASLGENGKEDVFAAARRIGIATEQAEHERDGGSEGGPCRFEVVVPAGGAVFER